MEYGFPISHLEVFLARSRGQLHLFPERTARGLESGLADTGANLGSFQPCASAEPDHWCWLSVRCNGRPAGPKCFCGYGQADFFKASVGAKKAATLFPLIEAWQVPS